jgi:hypothetical protein
MFCGGGGHGTYIPCENNFSLTTLLVNLNNEIGLIGLYHSFNPNTNL